MGLCFPFHHVFELITEVTELVIRWPSEGCVCRIRHCLHLQMSPIPPAKESHRKAVALWCFSLGDRRCYLVTFCNSSWLYLKTSSVYICALLLPWSIQNQRLTYQDYHLLSHLLSLHLLYFPTGRVYQFLHPWVLQSESVLWGNIPIMTISLDMVGREVHLQG